MNNSTLGQARSAARPVRPTVAFERPVVVLSAPRSGSTLLFETMARAPGVFTIGAESHRAFETLAPLHPAQHAYGSNRLTEADATPEVIAAVHWNFAQLLRDRNGQPPATSPVRFLEKTPKNSLRIPFMRTVLPGARFIVLYRDPRETIASMIDAWQSGRFCTYPRLPGWSGLPWSLLLVPGWRELNGRPLPEIAAIQWARTLDVLLDDLEMLPHGLVETVRYDAFVRDPHGEVERIRTFAEFDWDSPLDNLPLSRFTLTPPNPNKWRRHEAEIERVLPSIAATVIRAERFFAS